MATYMRKLKSVDGNWIAPATKFSCVYQDGSNQSLETCTTNASEWMQNNQNRSEANATKITTLQNTVNALPGKLFPVGAIYITESYDSPAKIFGGSWTQVSKDRCIIGAGGSLG